MITRGSDEKKPHGTADFLFFLPPRQVSQTNGGIKRCAQPSARRFHRVLGFLLPSFRPPSDELRNRPQAPITAVGKALSTW